MSCRGTTRLCAVDVCRAGNLAKWTSFLDSPPKSYLGTDPPYCGCTSRVGVHVFALKRCRAKASADPGRLHGYRHTRADIVTSTIGGFGFTVHSCGSGWRLSAGGKIPMTDPIFMRGRGKGLTLLLGNRMPEPSWPPPLSGLPISMSCLT